MTAPKPGPPPRPAHQPGGDAPRPAPPRPGPPAGANPRLGGPPVAPRPGTLSGAAPRPGPPRDTGTPRGGATDPAHAAVAAAMAGLDDLDGRPLAEHVAAFEQVHAALGDALAAGSTG